MHAEKEYTSRLGAGLGMIPESLDLLRTWQPGMTPMELSRAALAKGIFARTTARRNEDLAIEMFAPRFLGNGGLVAARIKFLIDRRFPHDSLVQIFFLQTARAHEIFKDFVIDVYWPKYSSGALVVTKSDAEKFVQHSLDTGKMRTRWSESTIRRVSGYLLGCCVDFGLLDKGKRTERPIKRFSVRKDVVLYLLHELHFDGLSDMAVVQHRDWRLFGLEFSDVVQLAKSLSHDSHLIVQSTPEMVQISWKYRSMEECLDVLTQRQV
jgi:hypothetical protein